MQFHSAWLTSAPQLIQHSQAAGPSLWHSQPLGCHPFADPISKTIYIMIYNSSSISYEIANILWLGVTTTWSCIKGLQQREV